MRALVIGADGFAGRWLVRHLLDSGDEVWGAVGPRFRDPLEDEVPTRQIDVRDAAAMAAWTAESRPDAMYFLAGVSGRESRDVLDEAVGVSIFGALNTLAAASALEHAARLLYVSTGYVYAPSDEPVNEQASLAPVSVYAAAKLAGERALLTMAPSSGVEVVIARPFNHVGPGQRDTFVIPTIAHQIAGAPGGPGSVLTVRVRDASVVRDFSDVRDVVAAYRLLVERAEAGCVFNVASGSGSSLLSVAQMMARSVGRQLEVIETPRPGSGEPDAPVLIGDATRLQAQGWTPRHSLVDTLRDVLAQHRASTGTSV